MTDNNVIKLKKDNILKFEIQTAEGKNTGECLEFDLEDIELPLKYQELIEKDRKNKEYLKNQMTIIDKREDVKGKKLLSKNEEDKIKAVQEFFRKEIDIYNMFLGENGVQKILNGRKVGWTSLQEVDDIITEQIAPHLNTNMENITEKIKEKYSQAVARNKEVLK